MRDVEAGALRLGRRGFDDDVVAEAARDEKARTRVDHRVAGEPICLEHLVLGESRAGREHRGRRAVEHLEIARVEHDAGGIAFAPLDAARHGVGEVGHYFGAMRNAPSSRITSPLRYRFSTIWRASAAYCSGLPSTCGNGIDAARPLRISSVSPISIGVKKMPGAMAQTRMPNCASSRAAGSVSATMPPFEDE